jgi:hypothetical protein
MAVYYLGDVEGRLYVDLNMPQGSSIQLPSAQLPAQLPGQIADIPPSPLTRCTKDVRPCPDGSFVSRSGPNCTFAPCPTDSLEAETIALEKQINRSGLTASYEFASGILKQYLEGVAMGQLILNAKLLELAFDEKVASQVNFTKSLPGFQAVSNSTYTKPIVTLSFVSTDGGPEDSKVEFFRREYGARLQDMATPTSDIEGDRELTFPVRSSTAEKQLFALVQEASMNPKLGAEVVVSFTDIKSATPRAPILSETPLPFSDGVGADGVGQDDGSSNTGFGGVSPGGIKPSPKPKEPSDYDAKDEDTSIYTDPNGYDRFVINPITGLMGRIGDGKLFQITGKNADGTYSYVAL